MHLTKLVGLTAVAMSAVTMLVGGFSFGVTSRPAFAGREVFRIVGTTPGPRHAHVTAKGAFSAHGYFLRKKASLIFPKGRLAVRRHVLSTKVSPPNLATCWFKAQQNGTFRVFYSTGKYKGLRYSGKFWTHISGRLKSAGHDQCASQIVYYRTVTYEIGKIP